MTGSTQWPVKIMLAHPNAEFMKGEKLRIAADCAVLSNKKFTEDFESDTTTLIGCPMLEDPDKLEQKIELIVKESDVEEIEIYSMEVPCCHALYKMVDHVNDGDVSTKKQIVRVEDGNIENYKNKIDKSMIEKERQAHGGGK